MNRIRIIGIGNVLMGDDALGPYMVQILESAYAFPEDVTLIDAGTPGLDLTAFFMGTQAVIVVDTVRAKGDAGEVRLYRREELLRSPLGVRLSPHDPGLNQALRAAEFHGDAPRDVLLVGVIPERVDTGAGLSQAVRRALPRVEAEILRELARFGVVPTVRKPRKEPDIWWEREPGAPRQEPAT
ncbi:MAG: hydrogenase maturation protease [Acidobacteriota bacterium]